MRPARGVLCHAIGLLQPNFNFCLKIEPWDDTSDSHVEVVTLFFFGAMFHSKGTLIARKESLPYPVPSLLGRKQERANSSVRTCIQL